MTARRLVDVEGNANLLTLAEPKPPVIIVLLQVEFLWPLEAQRQGTGGKDAVDRQAALVIETFVAANEVEPRPLLGEAERHHLDRGTRAYRVFVIEFEPAVGVKGVADFLEDAGLDLWRQQRLRFTHDAHLG